MSMFTPWYSTVFIIMLKKQHSGLNISPRLAEKQWRSINLNANVGTSQCRVQKTVSIIVLMMYIFYKQAVVKGQEARQILNRLLLKELFTFLGICWVPTTLLLLLLAWDIQNSDTRKDVRQMCNTLNFRLKAESGDSEPSLSYCAVGLDVTGASHGTLNVSSSLTSFLQWPWEFKHTTT